MTVHPTSSPATFVSTESTFVNIEAWADGAVQSLQALSLADSPPPRTTRTTRGTSVALEIPLDEEHGRDGLVLRSGESEETVSRPRVAAPRRELLRRDSLKRREALLKGKEGSRRRQKWENDRLLGNPYAQPPLPSDWEVRPTHPVHAVPYFLAPLWEAKYAARAADKNRRKSGKKSTAGGTAAVEQGADGVGHVPKELRQKLKRSRAAKGLLQDLEMQVRQFVQRFSEEEARLRTAKEQDGLPADPDSEDDEVVFVGRSGQMHDMEMQDFKPEREKLVFDSLEEDAGAAFGRWLVHSIGLYYGLDTWSVTVGNPARREAYVGIKEVKLKTGKREAPSKAVARLQSLPRPLWALV